MSEFKMEFMPTPLNQDFLERIIEDLEIGLVEWRGYPESNVYKHRLERKKKLEKYLKEQY